MGRYPEDGEKVCSACGQKKAFAAFYRQQNLDGRMDVCIVCFKAKSPTKVCNTCHIEQPLDAFPVHPSSADGHKYTCSACLDQQKTQQRQANFQYRIDERKRKADAANQRAEQNRLLKAYGYRWHKEEAWDEWHEEYREAWVLYSPDREVIEVQAALQRITQLQGPRYGHPSALWARDICALPNAVVLDTETTGLGRDAEIIDLGIISIGGKKVLNQLMQCEMSQIPADATRVHGITKAMLDREHAPTFPQIWKKLMERLETYVILIYNADFDRQMLEQTARRYNLSMPKLDIRCMMRPVADYIGGGRKAYKLEVACQYFHVENTNAHRAFADAQASQRVLQAMAQMATAPAQEENIPILHVTPVKRSGMQLKEVLDLYGRATNPNSAWGYSPDPLAERLEDGKIKVTTYHFESEWREHICDTPEEVDRYLYSESSVVSASIGGKRFEACLVLTSSGFNLDCTIDGKKVSYQEYGRAFPEDSKEGEWLPFHWDGPGEWAKPE